MSFNIALSGIQAINTELDVISNNIANVGTVGYKSSRANYSARYSGLQATGTEVGSLTQSIDVGGGVSSTGRGLDARINDRGFFTVRDAASGAVSYTRVGSFSVDAEGFLVDTFKRRVQGFPQALDANGAVLEDAAPGALGDLKIRTGQIPAQASTSMEFQSNLSNDWTTPGVAPFDMDNPKTYNSTSATQVFDSRGTEHTVTQYFVKGATGDVTSYLYFDDVATTPASTVLTFDTNGALATVDGVGATPAPVPLPDGWTPSFPAVSVDLGTPVGASLLTVGIDYTGSTQFGGASTPLVNEANGNASGRLIDVSVDSDGSVRASYSNGKTQSMGSIALATFANEGGLTPTDATSWMASTTSGIPVYSTPGTGSAGELSAQALETSNVDITEQLVSLMTAQRNYQANTKVFSTENAMMQSLIQAV